MTNATLNEDKTAAKDKTLSASKPAASLTGDFVRRTREFSTHLEIHAEDVHAEDADTGPAPMATSNSSVISLAPIKFLWPKSQRMQDITIFTGSFCLATTLYSVVVAMS